MSWSLKRKAHGLLAAEQGTIRKDWGGRVSFALVYPNTYAVGMSNLGFQTIYKHLNELPDVVCERVFLPDPADLDELRRSGTAPLSLESQRPLTDFQIETTWITHERMDQHPDDAEQIPARRNVSVTVGPWSTNRLPLDTRVEVER